MTYAKYQYWIMEKKRAQRLLFREKNVNISSGQSCHKNQFIINELKHTHNLSEMDFY